MPEVKTIQPAPPAPDSAWTAAEAMGVDMNLLEATLAMTIPERFAAHAQALRMIEELEAAMEALRHD